MRFTACKSGKDRTGMSVTLEQINLLAAEFDLARTEQQRSLQAMRRLVTALNYSLLLYKYVFYHYTSYLYQFVLHLLLRLSSIFLYHTS